MGQNGRAFAGKAISEGNALKVGAKGRQAEERRQEMIYKRGKFYWYKFMWNGELIRESTKQGNDKVARQMESAHRTSLAKGEVGIREPKPPPSKSFAQSEWSRGQVPRLRAHAGKIGRGTAPEYGR